MTTATFELAGPRCAAGRSLCPRTYHELEFRAASLPRARLPADLPDDLRCDAHPDEHRYLAPRDPRSRFPFTRLQFEHHADDGSRCHHGLPVLPADKPAAVEPPWAAERDFLISLRTLPARDRRVVRVARRFSDHVTTIVGGVAYYRRHDATGRSLPHLYRDRG